MMPGGNVRTSRKLPFAQALAWPAWRWPGWSALGQSAYYRVWQILCLCGGRRGLEILIRKLLRLPSRPAILMLNLWVPAYNRYSFWQASAKAALPPIPSHTWPALGFFCAVRPGRVACIFSFFAVLFKVACTRAA